MKMLDNYGLFTEEELENLSSSEMNERAVDAAASATAGAAAVGCAVAAAFAA